MVVRPSGELDLASAEQLRAAMNRAQRTGKKVVLDLAGLQFMDAAGVRVVVDAAQQLGGRLELRPGPPSVHRLFVLTELEDELPFTSRPAEVSDRDAAPNVVYVRDLWERFLAGGVAALAEIVPEDVRWQSFTTEAGTLVGTTALETFWTAASPAATRTAPPTVQLAELDGDVIVRSDAGPAPGARVVWSLYEFDGRTLVRAVSFATEAEARAAHEQRSPVR